MSSSEGLGIRIQLDHGSEVVEWVLVLGEALSLEDLFSERRLDFIRVDDSSEIWVGNDGSWEDVVRLDLRSGFVASEDGVELLEGILGPDDESSQMTSWGELQEIESVNRGGFNSWKISEGLGDGGFIVVNNEWSSSLSVSSVSHFSLSSSDVVRSLSLFNISVGSQSFQESNSLGGLVNSVDGLVVNNQRNFWNSFDSVSSGQNQRRNSSSSDGGSYSVSLFSGVDLSVPSSPGLSWSEHSSSSAHVSKSSLASSVSTSSRYTGNTSNSSSSTP